MVNKIIHEKRISLIKSTWASHLNKHNNKYVSLIGLNHADFLKYIESQFKQGMNWNNHGWYEKAWHLKAEIPWKKWDLSNDDHFQRAFYYINVKPKWYVHHMKKEQN